MDFCMDCGVRLKQHIRKYCARCWDRRLVEREKREAKAKRSFKNAPVTRKAPQGSKRVKELLTASLGISSKKRR